MHHEKKENVSVEIGFPAHRVVLCAFNGTLVMGADAPQRKKSAEDVLYQCIRDNKILI